MDKDVPNVIRQQRVADVMQEVRVVHTARMFAVVRFLLLAFLKAESFKCSLLTYTLDHRGDHLLLFLLLGLLLLLFLPSDLRINDPEGFGTRRMAIANGTCVSFCNQPKAHYLTTSRESRRYVVAGASIWLR